MNEQELEIRVSQALKLMFPEPTNVGLRPAEVQTRRRNRVVAVVATVVAVAAVGITAAIVGAHSEPGRSRDVAGAGTASSTPPAWAQSCLPTQRGDRLGPAPEYVGLTMVEALELARRQSPDSIEIAGAEGTCNLESDLVWHPKPVAVVFDKTGADANARIVVAERVSSTWMPGT